MSLGYINFMRILFMLQQGDKLVSEYYSTLRGILEELNMDQLITSDIEQLKRQREEFQVAKFLSSLNSNFQGIRGQILPGETALSLNNVYARVL